MKKAVVALALMAVACGKGRGDRVMIQNKGSDTMVNVAQAWAEAYQKVNPKVAVAVSGGGSGTGIAALMNGTVDIANASRGIKAKERETAEKNTGKEVVEHVIGYDALAVYLHQDNPMPSISREQLACIYGEGGTCSRWSDVGVEVPGCSGQEIVRVSRQNNSGTYVYFREWTLGKKADFKLGSRDMSGSKDVVDLVENTPCAIGYSGLGYKTDEVKAACIAARAGAGRGRADGQHHVDHPAAAAAAEEKMVSASRANPSASEPAARAKVEFSNVTIKYGSKVALEDVSLDLAEREILGIIGPAGSGKTSLLKALNRTLENSHGAKLTGAVRIDGADVYKMRDVASLRRRIGMVAPLPVGLPMSIYDNVAFAPRMAGIRHREELDERVERCLVQSALWDEVKDRLKDLGTKLSGGQQQRLTIARALSHDPEILCLDEFSIAVDPVTTMRIEEVLKELQSQMSILLVTNLVQQARRLAARTAFLLMGELVEVGFTDQMFSRDTEDKRTFQYVHGLFG